MLFGLPLNANLLKAIKALLNRTRTILRACTIMMVKRRENLLRNTRKTSRRKKIRKRTRNKKRHQRIKMAK